MYDIHKWEGKYKFKIIDSETKEILKEEVVFNRIQDRALMEMGKALFDNSNDCEVKYLALGTQSATILNTVTSLGSETFRTYKLSSTLSDSGEVKNTFFILSNEAKFHIKEVGIFMGSTASATVGTGQLMSIINWDYDHTDKDVEIQVTRYDSFNRSTKDRSATAYTVSEQTVSTTKDVNFLIPMYIYPAVSNTSWELITDLAANYSDRIQVIINPNNGSGVAYDDNYYNAAAGIISNGGKTYGYVYSSYATRSTATIITEINNYYNWYPLSGFFIDEMANDADTNKYLYYQWIYDYIKSLDAGFTVIGNPGATTQEGYLRYNGKTTSDILCTFESSTSFATWANSTWTENYTYNNFYSICHGCMTQSVAETFIDNATIQSKYIFITDDVIPNPYDVLPTYLELLANYCKW